MSEALARKGKAGTEALSQLLNDYFSVMVGLAESYGGITAKFGGDAMLVLFPCRRNGMVAARRAVTCALEMQGQMARYNAIKTLAGTFNLAMKVGLGGGRVYFTTVGEPDHHLEYVVAGRLLNRCAEAEHHAQKGEVIVPDELLAYLGSASVISVGDGFSRVLQVKRRATMAPLPALPLEPQINPYLKNYLHPAIAQRLQAGRGTFVDEHRKTTVMFTRFADFDYDSDPQVGSKLQNYLGQVIQLVRRYDGYLRQVDMGDKGSKFIVLFGLPVAHEDDAERALRCALDLRHMADNFGIETATGINTGPVYCGLVGSARRVEYAAIGDAVNLSARLMQAARPGQILVGPATRQNVASHFEWETLPPLHLKGRSEPLSPFSLTRLAPAGNQPEHISGYSLPVVGREAELRRVRELMGLARQGQGQVVGLKGEAGLGKSRVVAEIANQARNLGLEVYSGECFAYASNAAYHPWQPIFREMLGLSAANLTAQAGEIEQVAAGLEKLNPALRARLPLLGPLLNLTIPDNDLTASLDPKLRKTLLENLALDYIRRRAQVGPLLIVLEDCHWLDAVSQDLLQVVAPKLAASPVILLVVYRPPEDDQSKLEGILAEASTTEIRLTEFSPTEAEQLIDFKLQKLYGYAAPELARFRELKEALYRRAQGNPFYIDEMLNLLNDRGIDPADVQAIAAFDWPESLQSLILSRIDRLSEEEKSVLKVASVIGRLFRAEWLWGAYPPLGTPEQVKPYLSSLERLDLTPLEKPEPELEYIFRHILTRDVAYNSLTFATRAMLHGRVADYIEHTYSATLDQYLDRLAYHYSFTGEKEKQRQYYRLAGEAARASYANASALDYFQRLLALTPGPVEQVELIKILGEINQIIGAITKANEFYHQALELADSLGLEKQKANMLSLLGGLYRRASKYEAALNFNTQSLEINRKINNQPGVAQALNNLGVVYYFQGNYSQAMECQLEALQIRENLADKMGITQNLSSIANIHLNTGNYNEALKTQLKALEIRESLGNIAALAGSYNNIGAIYWFKGEYCEALEYYNRALNLNEKMGDKEGISHALGNLGETYYSINDYPKGLDFLERSNTILLEINDRAGIALNLNIMGLIGLGEGDYNRALSYLEQALQIRASIGDKNGQAYSLYNIAQVYFYQTRLEEALAYFRRSLEMAEKIGLPSLVIANLTFLSRVYRQTGLPSPANEAVAQALAKIESTEVEAEHQKVIYFNLFQVLREMDHSAATGYLQKAYQALMTQLANVPEENRTVFLEHNNHQEIIATCQAAGLAT
jgi:class 3 adenylate cyclase/tetratricopeptide (TPR) repeat protein